VTGESLQYRAFISYARADRKPVEILYRRLESYTLPASARRVKPGLRLDARPLRPIFLDYDELVPGPDLPKAISAKLTASEFLIVACSPNSHRSRWVDLEIREFIRLGRRDHILTLILSGEPNTAARNLSSDLECLPPSLLSEFYLTDPEIAQGKEPLWVDWRTSVRDERKMFLRIVAALLGLTSLDQLIRRDAKYRRRRRMIFAAAVTFAAVLAVAAANATIAKERNRAQIFTEASKRAYEAGQYDKALLYSLLALPRPHGAGFDFSSREAQIASFRAAYRNRKLLGLPMPQDYENSLDRPVISPDQKRAWVWMGQKRADLIDLENGRSLKSFKWSVFLLGAPAVFDSSSKRLAAASDDQLVVLDAATGRQLFKLAGNAERFNFLAALPISGRIAGATDHTFVLWDWSGGRLAQFNTHNTLMDASFSADGRYCIASLEYGLFGIFDVETGKQIATIDLDSSKRGPSRRAALSADGQTALLTDAERSSNDTESWLYHVPEKRLLAQVFSPGQNTPFDPTSAVFSPDGKRVVVPQTASQTLVLDAKTGAVVFKLEGTGGWPDQCAFLPGRQRIITVAAKSVVIWDGGTGRKLEQLPVGKKVTLLSFSRDGDRIILTSNDEISIWDAAAKMSSTLIASGLQHVTAIAMSLDASKIAILSQQNLRVLDAASAEPVFDVAVPSYDGGSVAFSRDGSQVSVTSLNHVVHVWQLATRQQNPVLAEGVYRGIGISSAAFSPTANIVGIGLGDSTARLIDLSTGHELAVLRGHDNEVTAVSFSKDGTELLTSSSDSTVRAWDVSTGRLILRLQLAGTGEELSSHFSPDGSRVVTGSANGSARVWASRTGELLGVLESESQVKNVFFSSDGKRIFNGAGDIWDAHSFRRFEAPSDVLAVSPNAEMLVTRRLEIEDAQGAGLIASLSSWDASANLATFSPDGTFILAALHNGTVQMWHTPELADRRTLATRFCQPEIGGLLQLSQSDLAEYASVTRPGDDKPCSRAGILEWNYWRPQ
jgi:WD40 repeat protein